MEEAATVEQANRPAERKLPGSHNKMLRVIVERDIPMSVTLPIEVQADLANQPFPFLDTTLADLGIQESEVKERVVWVDTKKTQVKNKAGKLKEKEITILEVQLLWKSGDSESNLIFLFCPSGTRESPEARRQTAPGGENGLTPVQMTMALDTENKLPSFSQAQGQREI
uniref:Si:ch211-196f5.2 n=1 Tax=Astatotilapia calliptera TaxID=8154 RepID=A0A3P8QHZ8_ASTCA